MNLNEARKIIPELAGLNDQTALSVIHQTYYPDMDKADLASKLGMSLDAAPSGERTWGAVAKDVGITGLKGAISIPEAAVGMADLFSGGRAGKALDDAGFKPKQAKELLSEHYSDQQKAAFQAVQDAKGFGGTMAAALSNPSVIGHSIVESMPSMLAGGAIGKGIVKGAQMLGMGGRGLGIGAAAAGEGAVATGSAAEQIRQQTDDGLLNDKQVGAAAATGAATAALGMLGGKVAQKLGIADLDTMLVGATQSPAVRKGVVRSTLEGALSEGVLEELPQSISEQVLQNHALGKPLDEGVDQAAVLGLLSGAAMGGGANMANSFFGEKPKSLGDIAAEKVRADEVMPETGPMTRAANVATEIKANAVKSHVDGANPEYHPSASLTGTSMADMLQGRGDPLQASLAAQGKPAADHLPDAKKMVGDQSEQPLDMVPPGVDPETGEVVQPAPQANPLDFTGRTDEELKQARQSAQDPALRKALATELQARRAAAPVAEPAPATNQVVEPETKSASDKPADKPKATEQKYTPAASITGTNMADMLQGQDDPVKGALTDRVMPAAAAPAKVAQKPEPVKEAPAKPYQPSASLTGTSMADMMAGQTDPIRGVMDEKAAAKSAAKPAAPDVTLTNEGKTTAITAGDTVRVSDGVGSDIDGQDVKVVKVKGDIAVVDAADGERYDMLASDLAKPAAAITSKTGQDAQPAPAQAPAVTAESGATLKNSVDAAYKIANGYFGSDYVSSQIQNDWQKLLDAAGEKDAQKLAALESKYRKDEERDGLGAGTSGVGPGKVKQARRGAAQIPRLAREIRQAIEQESKSAPVMQPATSGVPEEGAGGSQPPQAAPEFVKVGMAQGGSVHVKKSDMDGDKTQLPMYTADGKRKGGTVHRENLDPTGEKLAKANAETADNPLFDVITRKDGGAFATKMAALRELKVRGMADSHEVVPAQDGKGFIGRKKQEAAPQDAKADMPKNPEESNTSGERVDETAKNEQVADGQQLTAGDLLDYFDKVVAGSEKGEKIANPRFHIGDVDESTAQEIAKYIEGYDGKQRRLRVSGRTLKHIHESRPAIAREIVEQLPGMFTKPDEVLPDHRHVNKRALLVKERKSDEGKSKPNSYVATVEVEIEVEVRDGFIDIVTIMTAPDRSLREARELKKNWPEGQQRTEQAVNSPHPLTPKNGANPEADFPDARPVGDSLSQTGPATQAESPKPTQAEAADLMEWQSLGTKGGVTKHILTFFESKADKDANRGRMTVATVTKGDRSASAWMVDGDDQTFGPLSLAKKRGMEVGMARAVSDGFVESGEAKQPTQDQAPAKAKKKPQTAKQKREALESHYRPGNVIQSDYWKSYDRVVAFDWNDGSWKVTVEEVKKDGDNWKAAGDKRTHMTKPDARDKVVFEAPAPEANAEPAPPAEPAPAKEVEPASKIPEPDSGEFVSAPDGGLDFGEITLEMSKAMRRQAGKIRLRKGDETQGLLHIEAGHLEQLKNLGFDSVQEFVSSVAKSFTAIYKRDGAALDVVLDDVGRGRLMVQLEMAADGDYYDVKTASPILSDQFKNKKPLWERTGTSAPVAESNPPSPRGQSGNDSLSQTQNKAQSAETDKPAKIEDSGEVLEGARKLYAKSYAAKLDEGTGMETASVPLSKSWPEPDYQRLIEEGADPWAVALARAVRDEIPTKPTKAWKLKGWVAKVEGLRDMAKRVMDGSLTKERFTEEAVKFRLDDWLNKVELYEAVGHAESLKGMKFAENTYSFFGGQKFDPPKRLWTVNAPSTSASATWSNGNWGNDLVVADTKAEAITKFKAWVAEQAAKAEDGQDKPTAKRTEFNVYSYRNNPKVFIVGKRISTTKSIDLMEFESSKEANAFIVANQDKLEAMLADAKAEQSERREENAPRVGDDHRSGGDVTTEQFRETFGFRGEQFGASMPQAERQANMNQAYDALMDLAGVIGVPPKALSLNGELGLAFGARGHGGKNPAMAHYEPDTTGAVTPNRVVINLTRKNGAGSLAHEWFHAVDNYFARMRGEKGGMLTESYPAKRDGVRPEMVDAFKKVMMAIQSTGVRERSKNMDKKRTKDYWSTGLEMAARSFESYVIAKLQDKSGANDYLANILPESAWLRENEYPYPTMGELPLIRAAFDNFFATVQTKETDKGVAMFSRRPDTKQAYEARIDALFAGEKANLSGVHLLDKSDVLDLLGLGNMPVRLDEAKVVLNQTNHPEMTAEVWKKIPEWLDNPALVTKSSTVDGRYVITPSETVLGYAVRIVVEPKGGAVQVHALVNAYAPMSANGPVTEAKRIQGQIGRGDVVYVDTKKASELLGRSGLQLPRVPSLNTDRKKILTEKNLSGYRKAQDPAMSRGFGTGMTKADAEDVVNGNTDRWANAPEVVVVQDMNDPEVPEAVRREDAKQKSQGASGEPEGFWYGGKAYIVAGALRSPGAVMRVLFHETLGHYGLRGTFGDGLTPILKQLAALRRTEVAAKAEQYGLDMGKEADRLTAAEEVLAEMAQSKPEIGYVKRVIALIRGFLRKHVPGFAKMKMTDEDIIANYITPARNYVERGPGGGPKGGVSFSRGTNGAMPENTAPGQQGDAQQGANQGNAVTFMESVDPSTLVFREEDQNRTGAVRADFPDGVYPPLVAIKESNGDLLILDGHNRAAVAKEEGQTVDVVTISRSMYDRLSPRFGDMEIAYAALSDAEQWDAASNLNNQFPGSGVAENGDKALSEIWNDQSAPVSGGAMFSRSVGATELAGQVRDKLNETFNHPGKLSWWHKTVGSQYNLAERNPAFKKVFDAAQSFINDVSYYGTEAANMAPKMLPKLETFKDLTKTAISAADNKAVAAPVFEGTLSWARDADGKPIRIEALEKQYENLTDDQKAQMLLRKNAVSEAQLKAWKASKLDVYTGAIRNRFESTFLKAGVRWTDAELKSIFKLNDDQVGLYQEFRAATDTSLDNMAKAQMLREAGKDVEAMRDAVMEAPDVDTAAMMLRETLLDMAKDDPDRADVLTDAASGVMATAAKINELKKQGYAPLSRFGRFTVDVVVDGQREYFGLFESEADSNKMAAKMRMEFGADNVAQGTMSQKEFELFQGITPESLELFGNMMGLDSTGNEAQDKAFQTYLKLTKNNRSAMKRLIHRQGIAGYSEDVGRVLAAFVYANARQTSAALHIGQMDEAITAIPKGEGELKDHALELAKYVKEPREEAAKLRGLMFAQYLGGSVASAMVNFTQPLTVSIPYLSQFGGLAKAGKAWAQAVADMKKGTKLEAGLEKALKDAEESGVVSPQEIHQLMAQARGEATLQSGDGTRRGDALAMAKNGMTRTALAWGKLFGYAEQVNRRSTFIAAYRLAVDQKIANPGAFAEKAVNETQFINNKANKMKYGRGAIGATLMTFKSYSLNWLELMHRLSTQDGKEGKLAAAYMLGALFLVAGAGGLPFAEDAEDLIDAIGQKMGYNMSTKKAKQEFLEDVFGKAGAQFVERGLTGIPGVPIDVSGRMGMQNLLPGTGLLLEKKDHTRDVMELAGPAGEMVQRMFQAVGQLASGNLGQAIESAAPKAASNLIKGADMLDKGMYRDTKGAKVIDTTEGEALAKMIGFQPQSVAKVQESNFINQRAKDFYSLKTQEIRAKWAMGIFEADQDKVKEARQMMDDWNQDNPDQKMTANMPAIVKKVREMRKDKAQRIADTAPNAMRAQMREDARELANQ